ncbi:hypothetical protein RSOLAG1IB_03051 [Rhizoctonia solani AG-1 IB]|uniref:Survival Motor Neuron Gemin2-binding domain-containing protein n=1 Tax=Thanatephorus cucumeris (strain AG1-IB / isolate 7/3/14) TaxID=1108050 RepID=A0A0B7FKU1_THACB|nr:hypothetical protein RSOLAG1IB_03051 [Rhizoctonia solani AG-1 IB]
MFRGASHKRKRGNGARGDFQANRNWSNNQHQQPKHRHWDEPGDSSTVQQSEVVAPPAKKPKRYQIDHSLTQDELWDDSALIAAWDAATEEYESLNGPEKKWKEEPANKSALWYAPPSEPQDDDNEEDDEEEEGGELEENSGEIEQITGPDSAPIDYNTFVPSYDPTLGVAQTSIGHPQLPAATNDLTKLTKDEIFEKAVSASYWAGYWTAMYHAHNETSQHEAEVEEEVEADEMVHVLDAADMTQQTES